MSEPWKKKPRGETKCHEAMKIILSFDNLEDKMKSFWSKIDIKGPKECWNWTSTKTKTGYGKINLFSGTTLAAHRISWVIHHNTLIPDNLHICHKCDNPICCNPNHLFLASSAINSYDAVIKGRKGLLNGTVYSNPSKGILKNRDMSNAGKPGHFRTGKILSIQRKKEIIIGFLNCNESAVSFAKNNNITIDLLKFAIKRFFKNVIDRSWLPEPLKSKYGHCKSWKEAKNIKYPYAIEREYSSFISQNERRALIIGVLTNKNISNFMKKYKDKKKYLFVIMNRFFVQNFDRSFLPELLKTRYSHCKSWVEAKELKKKYDEQDRQAAHNQVQPTNSL